MSQCPKKYLRAWFFHRMLMNDTNLSEGCIFVVDRAVKRWYFQISGAVFSMYLENVRVVIHLAALHKNPYIFASLTSRDLISHMTYGYQFDIVTPSLVGCLTPCISDDTHCHFTNYFLYYITLYTKSSQSSFHCSTFIIT